MLETIHEILSTLTTKISLLEHSSLERAHCWHIVGGTPKIWRFFRWLLHRNSQH